MILEIPDHFRVVDIQRALQPLGEIRLAAFQCTDGNIIYALRPHNPIETKEETRERIEAMAAEAAADNESNVVKLK